MTRYAGPVPDVPAPTETTLRELAVAAATILAEDANTATVAIPLLHIRNAHPSTLKAYHPILEVRHDLRAEWRAKLTGFVLAMQAFRTSGAPWAGDVLPPKADVLLLSHFLRTSQAGNGEDLYFGKLPAALAAGGVSSVTALLNHTRLPWRRIAPEWLAAREPRVLLSRLGTAKRERAYGRALGAAAKRLQARSDERSMRGRLARAAALQGRGSGARTALRLADQIGQLVDRLRPRLVIGTYEGHSWERLAFQAIRQIDPSIVCVGYSHAVLFPFSHAMSTRLGDGYDPDMILTAGDITREQLRQAPGLEGIPIETLGSPRAMPSSLVPRNDLPQTCLVLPEGLVSESVMLVMLAAETARLMPHRTFRIRLHPVLTSDMVLRAIGNSPLPVNVTWSSGNHLEADFDAADMVLYRGSSAAIQATQAGLKPIYHMAPGETFSMDPLRSLVVWREQVTTALELAETIAAAERLDLHERQEQRSRAQAFCDKYFMPMQPDVVLDLLRVGSARG